MKTFREFVIEADNYTRVTDGSSYGGGSTEADIRSRTDLTPEQKEKLIARARARRVSGQDIRGTQTPPRQPSGSTQSTQTPPRQSRSTQSTQTPPRSTQASSGSTPPPRNTSTPSGEQQTSSSRPKPNLKSKLGTGFRRGLGALGAVDAVNSAAQGNYGDAASSALLAAQGSRRLSKTLPQAGRIAVQRAATSVGQRQAGRVAARFVPGLQQAYGLTRGTQALAKGDKLGAALGYASAVPGPIGWVATGADIARETLPSSVKKTIKDKTGISYLQQRKGLEQKAIQSGQGLSGIERARQTMNTRGARQVAAQSGTYGARQGSVLTGTGGPTTVNRKSNTITSGQRTAKLASTQLVRDPKTGQQRVGDLAYRGGQAVYLARPSVSSRDTSLSARVGRALNIGKYSKSAEQQAAKTEYRTALRNTQQYQRQLGVTPKAATAQKLPGRGVGPKKVGPKIVGPKKVGPKIVGTKK